MPFTVTRVLKGAEPPVRGAEFSEGEQAIVFLGTRDRADGSYDVLGGRRGKFVELSQTPGNLQGPGRSHLRVLLAVAVLAPLGATGWLMRRRTR